MLQDGEAQLMMGRMVPVLQVTYTLTQRLVKYYAFAVHDVGPGQFYWKDL